MHFPLRSTLLCAFALLAAAPARADVAPVRVEIPLGLGAGDVTTQAAPDPTRKYVTVGSVRLANPSRYIAQGFEPTQFHLLVDDVSYTPSVRPGLAALDLSSPSLLGPGESTTVTVSFLVPVSVTTAKFEFTPHWQSDDGHIVDFCCLYR
jgi:hypothetical protein